MRAPRFSVAQIADVLRRVETGVSAAIVCRELGISEQTFYVWKRRFGGMGTVEIDRIRKLEEENHRLRRMVDELTLERQMLQEALEKKD